MDFSFNKYCPIIYLQITEGLASRLQFNIMKLLILLILQPQTTLCHFASFKIISAALFKSNEKKAT
jgi:hypothetical protein